MARTYYEVLSEPFKDDKYLPYNERKGRSKIVPKNGGKTPDSLVLWEDFEREVMHFVRSHCVLLQASTVPSQFSP